jgi:hypothetical protein
VKNNMPFELKDVKITHISLVEKGANGVPFAIVKGANSVEKKIQIAKSDTVKQIVYGVVYEPNSNDAHDDFMTADEIEKMAHDFMQEQHTYNIDKQHNLNPKEGYVIESYIAPCEMQLGEQTIQKGSWVVGVKVTDETTWDQIVKGEITGFSMWGEGQRVPAAPTSEEGIVKSLISAITQVFSKSMSKQEPSPVTVSKAVQTFRSKMQSGDVKDKWYNSVWIFEDTIYEIMRDDEVVDKVAAVDQTITEFRSYLLELTEQWPVVQEVIAKSERFEAVKKAGKILSSENQQLLDDAIAALVGIKEKSAPQKGETELDIETITKAVAAAVAPITKDIGTLTAEVEKLKNPEPPAPENGASEIGEAVAKALEPLQKQVEGLSNDVQVLKNTRAASAQPIEVAPVAKSTVPSYIAAITKGE